jgi:heat shock protein HslJ
MSLIKAIAALAVATSAACQMPTPAVVAFPTPHSALPAASPLGAWSLQAVNGLPIRPGDVSLNFRADGTLTGSIDCNSFRGAYTYRDGMIAFGPIALTERGCETVIPHQTVIERSLGAGPFRFVSIGNDAARLEGRQVLTIVRRR